MFVLQDLQHRPGFPELMRRTRLRAGLTQQQLADLSALSVRAVRDLETGRVRRPRRDTVRLLAAPGRDARPGC
jgi:transcriptional regulator with XRE-family HTH domain